MYFQSSIYLSLSFLVMGFPPPIATHSVSFLPQRRQ